MSDLESNPGAMKGTQAKSFEERLYKLLGDEYCGNTTMPLDSRRLRWHSDDGVERVVMFVNDAHELGFGHPDEWQMIIRRSDFHRVILWYARQWAFSEWLGLRRWAWYRLLHRRVEATRRAAKQ